MRCSGGLQACKPTSMSRRKCADRCDSLRVFSVVGVNDVPHLQDDVSGRFVIRPDDMIPRKHRLVQPVEGAFRGIAAPYVPRRSVSSVQVRVKGISV